MNLVCLLEEESAKAMLEGVFQKILPHSVVPFFIVFEGKQDLEQQMTLKIRRWNRPDSVFLVMRDQDAGNCKTIKSKLAQLCRQTGKYDRTLIRIACHELESFYFGDLNAVEKGLRRPNISRLANKAKYRIPDGIINPCAELEKLTNGQYQHISGSRAIAPHLKINGNTSKSFNILIKGVQTLIRL
jgi:hypothetical protein